MCAPVQLFANSSLESKEFTNLEELSNHMGLFLQVCLQILDCSNKTTCCAPVMSVDLSDAALNRRCHTPKYSTYVYHVLQYQGARHPYLAEKGFMFCQCCMIWQENSSYKG